jgi:Secretion system C-terminal sorting domain
MKTTIQIAVMLLLQTTFSYAQNNLNVVITGDCSDGSAVYIYDGVLNGKNTYINTVTIDGETQTHRIDYNSIGWWSLHQDIAITDYAFYTFNVPAGLLPPFTGWTEGYCTGTISFNPVLSNQEFENSKIAFYPNPATDFVFIKNNTQNLEYVIFDSNGRTVKEGSASQKIEVASLQKGLYLIKMNNFSYKFLKQ